MSESELKNEIISADEPLRSFCSKHFHSHISGTDDLLLRRLKVKDLDQLL